MSRLTPTKEMTDFQLQAALDIVANFTMNLKQAEKLVRAITISEDQSVWAPDVDTMADEFYTADLNNRRDESEPDEKPYIGATIGREDQPSWMRAFNELSIRG